MKLTKTLTKILWLFIYTLPAVLFFSYHPVISLGADASMNFELSLPLIWLVLFDLGSFILMLCLACHPQNPSQKPQPAQPLNKPPKPLSKTSARSTSQQTPKTPLTLHLPGLTDRRFFLLALLPLYLTLSIFWSANPLRGLLTAGVMWLIFFAVLAMLYILPLAPTAKKPPLSSAATSNKTSQSRRLRTRVLLVMFVSSVLVCKFCYAQSIMDILGAPRETTLLCPGCTYRSFGFPHPSGFAIEPQFMGNLLLAPTLTAIYLLVFRPKKSAANLSREVDYFEDKIESKVFKRKLALPRIDWSFWKVVGMTILAGFLSTTLFFTFSRGAIYAYAVALLILLIFAIKRKAFRWSLITVPAVSLLLALTLQGTFAAVGPTAETFVSGITKSIHQLSLGIIDLRQSANNPSISNSLPTPDSFTAPVENPSSDCGKTVQNLDNSVDKATTSVQNNPKNVDKSPNNCAKPVEKVPESVENIAAAVDKLEEDHVEKAEHEAESTAEAVAFEGYVAESTNIRLSLNQTAIKTWLSAPGRSQISVGSDCGQPYSELCTTFTPTSILFGVGLGGAGTAMHAAHPDKVTSSKEIVQHEGFSLLLETGTTGIALVIFGLLVAFFPNLFSQKFLDGKSATTPSPTKSATSAATSTSVKTQSTPSSEATRQALPTFWHHPALPLLAALIVAYLVTLNFFSGLPNALQIYLMPPLLYLIFSNPTPSDAPKSS